MPKEPVRPACATRAAVAVKVFEIVEEHFTLSWKNPVTRNTRFKEDLTIDDLDIVELEFLIEDIFGQAVPDKGIEYMKTVGELVDCVCQLLAI